MPVMVGVKLYSGKLGNNEETSEQHGRLVSTGGHWTFSTSCPTGARALNYRDFQHVLEIGPRRTASSSPLFHGHLEIHLADIRIVEHLIRSTHTCRGNIVRECWSFKQVELIVKDRCEYMKWNFEDLRVSGGNLNAEEKQNRDVAGNLIIFIVAEWQRTRWELF